MMIRSCARRLGGGIVASLLFFTATNAALAQTPPAQPAAPAPAQAPAVLPPPAPPPAQAAPPQAPAAGAQPDARPSNLPKLTLDAAVARFNQHGFDLVIADAQVAMSQADKLNLTQVPNPTLNGGVGKVFGYDPSQCSGCSDWTFNVGITDNAAIMRSLVGKRDLRGNVADAAIAAAKMSKEDARRTLVATVKNAYIEVARAQKAVDLAKETQDSWQKMVNIGVVQGHAGASDEGAFARIMTAKLQADVALDQAQVAVEAAKHNLLFLLGERTATEADFDVDADTINYSVPSKISSATVDGLLKEAKDDRPDLRVVIAQKEHAQQGIDLAKRERVPDIALGLNYSQTGTGQNALSPPTLGVGVTIPLPVFYQNQGDIAHAQADLFQQETQQKKTLAQIETDVRTAWAQYTTTRRIVERYETGGLIENAKKAVEITTKQQELGKQGISLIDVLDARRTYISVNNDRLTQLAAYWNAVFALEQAVGTDLRH
jgi:cobalt-zinc-cadmium efflux system outer membrane protein